MDTHSDGALIWTLTHSEWPAPPRSAILCPFRETHWLALHAEPLRAANLLRNYKYDTTIRLCDSNGMSTRTDSTVPSTGSVSRPLDWCSTTRCIFLCRIESWPAKRGGRRLVLSAVS